MSYEAAREHLAHVRDQIGELPAPQEQAHLVAAIDELTGALEQDLAQIKAAIGHVARLLED